MKILFLSRLFHPHVGGVETHVLELSKRLIQKGHRVSLITEGYDEALKSKQTYEGIEVYRIPLSDIKEESKKFAIWEWLWLHRKLIRQADIVHVHDVIYWLFPFFWLNKKIYITFHGYEGSGPPTKSAIWQRKLGEFLAMKTINIGAFMGKWYRASPDKVLYGAVGHIASKARRKDAIYIGRLHEDTGIMTYLSALLALRKKNIHLHLDVYGDGPQAEAAKEYVSKYKLPVTFHGFTRDAAKHLSEYRFAFVSRYLSILEAMLVRTPVFAVYSNEIKKDYLSCHPAYEHMVVVGGVKELTSALILSLKPSSAQKVSILRAQQWAKKQTWQMMAKEYLDLWQSTSATHLQPGRKD